MSDEESGNTLDIDIQELKQQLSLPDDTQLAFLELGERFDALNNSFGELLVYMNKIDERVQRMDGEPIVSTTIHQHIGQDGTAEVHRMRPDVPQLEDVRNPNSLETKDESRLAKMVVK